MGRYPAYYLMERMPIYQRCIFNKYPHAEPLFYAVLVRLSTGYPPSDRQVAYALLTRAPVADSVLPPIAAPRLACVKPVASVHPEPGSNSSLLEFFLLYP